jgi:hypothetical protein
MVGKTKQAQAKMQESNGDGKDTPQIHETTAIVEEETGEVFDKEKKAVAVTPKSTYVGTLRKQSAPSFSS